MGDGQAQIGRLGLAVWDAAGKHEVVVPFEYVGNFLEGGLVPDRDWRCSFSF